jgi:hypothetical protein
MLLLLFSCWLLLLPGLGQPLLYSCLQLLVGLQLLQLQGRPAEGVRLRGQQVPLDGAPAAATAATTLPSTLSAGRKLAVKSCSPHAAETKGYAVDASDTENTMKPLQPPTA